MIQLTATKAGRTDTTRNNKLVTKFHAIVDGQEARITIWGKHVSINAGDTVTGEKLDREDDYNGTPQYTLRHDEKGAGGQQLSVGSQSMAGGKAAPAQHSGRQTLERGLALVDRLLPECKKIVLGAVGDEEISPAVVLSEAADLAVSLFIAVNKGELDATSFMLGGSKTEAPKVNPKLIAAKRQILAYHDGNIPKAIKTLQDWCETVGASTPEDLSNDSLDLLITAYDPSKKPAAEDEIPF